MSGRPKRFNTEQVIEALKLAKGLVPYAARHLGCARVTIYDYMKRYPKIAEAREDERAEFVAETQLKLRQAVHKGEPWAIQLVLRTLGRDEGFAERTEVTGKDGGPIEHAHIHVWEEHLQRAHARIAAHKEAIRLERSQEGGYERPAETA